jgi:serine/threonine protein kinase
LLDRDGHIALTDFGLAKENMAHANGRTSTFCGTPEYLAPEIVKRQSYGLTVDWWCLGSVVYEMLVGLPPFYSSNTQELFQRILYDKLKWPSQIAVSAPARAFVGALLIRNPDARLGAKGGATEVKRHPFFAGVDWDKLVSKLYRPPFVPDLESTMDLRYIDPSFKDGKMDSISSVRPNDNRNSKSLDSSGPDSYTTAIHIPKSSKDTRAGQEGQEKASRSRDPDPDPLNTFGVPAPDEDDDYAFAGFTYHGNGPDEDVLRDLYGDNNTENNTP